MSRPSDDDPEPKTVLDKVRPTVVRRRVYEPAAAGPSRTLVHTSNDDDDAGPPSSVNVARALASLRGDELKRLEEIVSADDDPMSIRGGPASLRGRPSSAPMLAAPPSMEAPAISETISKPVLRLGPTIALGDLALGLGVSKQDLVTALVTRGFFSITVKSMVSRETARLAADMYGMATEDDDTIAESEVQRVGKAKKKGPSHDKPKPMPKPPTSKKPSAPKRSVNRGR